MKILQVCAYAAPYEGNFMKSLFALEKVLVTKGFEVVYAFPEKAKSIMWCQRLAQNHTIYYLPLSGARLYPATYILFKRIYQDNPDIIIVHSHFELYDVPATAMAPKNIQIYWHLHDPVGCVVSKKEKLLLYWQYRFCSKRAKLLSVSQKHRDVVISMGFDSKRAFYVPNGIDTSRIELIRINSRRIYYDFLLFGWDHLRKGVDLAVYAGSKISQHCLLGIVANESTWEHIHKDKYNGLTVIKINPVDNVNELYSCARCFMHISRGEGHSYALLEAIYAGLPVIASDIEENLFAKEFPTVLFVKSENINEIAVKMLSVLKGEFCITMHDINYARKIIIDKYSLESWTNQIIDYYGVQK